MDILFFSLSCVILLAGFFGLFVPAIPGLPLMWAGMFLYALVTDFQTVTAETLIWAGVLALLGQMLEYVANFYGAKRFGASRWGIFGLFMGLVLGIILFGPFGVVVGPIVGAFVGEMLGGRSQYQALRSSAGAFVGFLGGLLVQMLMAFVMVGLFLSAVL